MSPKKNPTHCRKSITLRDVIAHIQAMKGEVLQKIGNLEKRMDRLEKRLIQRIDALEEDLTATLRLAVLAQGPARGLVPA